MDDWTQRRKAAVSFSWDRVMRIFESIIFTFLLMECFLFLWNFPESNAMALKLTSNKEILYGEDVGMGLTSDTMPIVGIFGINFPRFSKIIFSSLRSRNLVILLKTRDIYPKYPTFTWHYTLFYKQLRIAFWSKRFLLVS